MSDIDQLKNKLTSLKTSKNPDPIVEPEVIIPTPEQKQPTIKKTPEADSGMYNLKDQLAQAMRFFGKIKL